MIEKGCGWELRLGRWQDVLIDVEADAMITDPPYSDRTHKGVRTGSTMKAQRNQNGMGYDPITQEWVESFVTHWTSRCAGWIVVYGDHITNRWWEEALAEVRYAFAPLPLVKVGASPRMCADGPASQSELIAVARPKKKQFVGSWPGMPGWYSMTTVRHCHGHSGVRGVKSLDHMRAVVRDYSRPGDLIVDPCVGSGTTILAAVIEGRRAIGAEKDQRTYDIAVNRLRYGYTPSFPGLD